LSDATAYNVQFVGPRPVFIDALSFRRYREGEYWTGHRQFCEQVPNPLLLTALLGVAHNASYRGPQVGVPAPELARLLPAGPDLAGNVLTHGCRQESLQSGARSGDGRHDAAIMRGGLPRASYRAMLDRLRARIAGLEPLGRSATV